MKKFILLFCCFYLTACDVKVTGTKTPESITIAGKDNGWQVEKLFTVDGCSVYRFADGYSRYFTNCSGSTMTVVPNGKIYRPDGISGGM